MYGKYNLNDDLARIKKQLANFEDKTQLEQDIDSMLNSDAFKDNLQKFNSHKTNKKPNLESLK